MLSLVTENKTSRLLITLKLQKIMFNLSYNSKAITSVLKVSYLSLQELHIDIIPHLMPPTKYT